MGQRTGSGSRRDESFLKKCVSYHSAVSDIFELVGHVGHLKRIRTPDVNAKRTKFTVVFCDDKKNQCGRYACLTIADRDRDAIEQTVGA